MSDVTSSVSPQASDTVVDARLHGSPERRLRLWPGVLLVALQWLVGPVLALTADGTMLQIMGKMWGPMIAAALVMVWWLGLSGLAWKDRLLPLVAAVALGAVTMAVADPSIGGFVVIMFTLPLLTTVWCAWLLVSMFFPWPVRRAGLFAAIALAWLPFALIRFEGVNGSFSSTFDFRWEQTAEQRFLATLASREHGLEDAGTETMVLSPGDWPGFRGAKRDGILTGVRIGTDWSKEAPKLLWSQRVGPGWGSFAVIGNHLYTQEQWDKDEVVVCYRADTGKVLWFHKDKARFEETVAGAGPRATPTFHEGKIYAMGAAGRLNCLNAATGKLIWSRDIIADSGAPLPQWGFAASPLVTQGIVTVFGGAPGKCMLGYNAATGEPAWSAGDGPLSYCSPHPANFGGVEQVLITTGSGLTSIHPTQGKVLWHHDWPMGQGQNRVVQPAIVSDSDVLIGSGFNVGTQRVHVEKAGDKWTTKEVWHTRAMSPYFNDLVIHKGHLYGFNGSDNFACVNLDNSKKAKWSERGFGNGQVLCLADQDVLLILTEETGEVVLMAATLDGPKELSRFQALSGKRTWNHPVIAHGMLFLRNGEYAACYQLPGFTEKR